MRATQDISPILLAVALLTTGCGKQWEKFWGQDTKPQVVYQTDHGRTNEFSTNGDSEVRVLIPGLTSAKYVNIKVSDNFSAWIELPIFVPSANKSIGYIQDRDMITVFNLDAIPGLAKVRIEHVYNE